MLAVRLIWKAKEKKNTTKIGEEPEKTELKQLLPSPVSAGSTGSWAKSEFKWQQNFQSVRLLYRL